MRSVFDIGGLKRRKQALKWLQAVHADDMPEDQLMAYVTWMEADPRNAAEFHRLDQAWIVADVADGHIRDRAVQSAWSDVMGFSWLKPGSRFGWGPAVAVACSIVLIAVFVFSGVFTPTQQLTIVTAVGEQRDVELPDGTTLSLNTESELIVDYSRDVRTVRLVQGQAFFNVASNPGRPFIVQLNEGNVEVVGTTFDVLKKPDGFSVTVLEGRVAVSPGQAVAPNGNIKTLILKGNQRTDVSLREASLEAVSVDAEAATSWQAGQLVFRGAPLSEVLSELGRYTEQDLRLADAEMETIEFTGVLKIEDASLMATRLARLLSLNSSTATDGSILIELNAGAPESQE